MAESHQAHPVLQQAGLWPCRTSGAGDGPGGWPREPMVQFQWGFISKQCLEGLPASFRGRWEGGCQFVTTRGEVGMTVPILQKTKLRLEAMEAWLIPGPWV